MVQPRTIIFDWDGTLHESMIIYYPAFMKSLAFLNERGYTLNQRMTPSEVKPYLGMNPREMWQAFLPNGLQEDVKQASQIISQAMIDAIQHHQARLYPYAIEVLHYLKNKGYELVYLSNSKIYYMEMMKEAFHLDTVFDRMICSEMYQFSPKKDILAQMKSELKQPMVMIGDRHIDIETGRYNHAMTIGCAYGYGAMDELNDADHVITDLRELMTIL